MRIWIITIIVLILPFLMAISGDRAKDRYPENKVAFYFKQIGVSLAMILLFFLIDHRCLWPLDFHIIGKGITISPEVMSVIMPVFFIPLFLSLTPWNKFLPEDVTKAKVVFGLPVAFMPDNWKTFAPFILLILTGVIFEELLCRQVMFYAFHNAFGIGGDALLVMTSVLFSIGHLYQGWKGIFNALLSGLVFGKFFQLSGILAYPILLHLFLNLTIVVLAYKRIKALKRISTIMEQEKPENGME